MAIPLSTLTVCRAQKHGGLHLDRLKAANKKTLPVWAKVSLSTLIVVSWTGDFLSRIDDPTEAAGLPKLLPFGGNDPFYAKNREAIVSCGFDHVNPAIHDDC